MKWYAISGSWRTIDERVKHDVAEIARKIVLAGDGIVVGGALGVDYIATQVVLDIGKPKRQLKLFLPIRLKQYCKHYFKRAREGVITQEQAEMLASQLERIAKLASSNISDDFGFKEANVESYYARNTKIIESCDELYAFQVNNSQGTQDAINKAREMGKLVHVKKYTIKTN